MLVVVTGDPLTVVEQPPAVPRLSQVTRVTMGTRAPLLFRLTGVWGKQSSLFYAQNVMFVVLNILKDADDVQINKGYF